MIKLTQQDRLHSILKLSRSGNEWGLDCLAQTLDVSTRTIRKDIDQLNKELKGIAEFRMNKGVYWLHLINKDKYQQYLNLASGPLNMDSPQQRDAAILTRLLDASKPVLIDDLADTFIVARSTMTKDLKRLRLTLEPYDLTIRGRPNNGIWLEGNEWKKRLFILQNENVYRIKPLDHRTLFGIKKMAQSTNFEKQTEEEWIRYIQVMIQRTDLGQYLNLNDIPVQFQELKKTKEYREISGIISKMQERYFWPSADAERLFISLPLLGRRSPVNVLDSENVPISNSILQLINDIEKQMQIELNLTFDFEKIRKELGYHLMFMINRLVFGVHLHNTLIDEVKRKYPLAYEMAEIARYVIDKKFGIQTTESELGYLAYYFGIMVTEQDDQLKSLKQVAIICDTGRSTARIIEVQLSKILPEEVEKCLFSSNAVSKDQLEKFDLVFSTSELDFELSVPMILLNDIFDEQHLRNKLNQLFHLQKLNVPMDNKHSSLIKGLLKPEHFLIMKQSETYQQILDSMIDQLILENAVDARFKQRIIDKEKKNPIIFENEIAFPHAVNKRDSAAITFSIALIPHGIELMGKEIHLIFLLGVPEKNNDESLLISVYDEMLTLSKKDNIQKIIRMTNYAELQRFLNIDFHT
ncbi:MAG: PRD domain-containing protein [Sporolactobacillus sp.]